MVINNSEGISAGSPSCEIRDPSAEESSHNLVMKISGDCRGLKLRAAEVLGILLERPSTDSLILSSSVGTAAQRAPGTYGRNQGEGWKGRIWDRSFQGQKLWEAPLLLC